MKKISWIFKFCLLGLILFGYCEYKSFWIKNIKPKPPLIITDTLSIPTPSTPLTRFKDKLVYVQVPQVIVIDTNRFDISKYFYENPYGIYKLTKENKKVVMSMFRYTGERDNEVIFAADTFYLKYGGSFYIEPTRDENNPFNVKEKREYFDIKFGCGWSAKDYPYITGGVYLKGFRIKNFDAKVGLVSYNSFSNQDLRLEILCNF